MAENPKKPADEKKPETAPPNEQAAGGSNRPLLFGIIGAVVVANAVIALVLIRMTMPAKTEKAGAVAADSVVAEKPVRTSMGATTRDAPIDAIVNIAGTDGERFLKVAVVFEYDARSKELPAEIDRRRPRFKNMLIDQLSSMTLMELNEPGTKDRIRKEFLRRVNGTLDPKTGVIEDVWLDQFIIQ